MEKRDREPFVEAMSGAINAAKAQAATEATLKVFGTLIGFVFATFFLPLLVVYAWNGMTPDGWVALPYLPTVSALLFFRIMILWVKN